MGSAPKEARKRVGPPLVRQSTDGFSASINPVVPRLDPEHALKTAEERSEQLQAALYRISDCSHAANDLQQLYRSIHNIIGELIYAQNFYIALLDPGREWLHFAYSADQKESHVPRRLRKGLTEYVLRTGEPLLVDKKNIDNLKRSGELEQNLGAACVDWMGAPLKSGSAIFGVVALQSYDESIRYTERDKEMLTFVSQHIASAIDRKRKEEALRESEARYRSLVQSAVYGIYRSSVDDRFLDVNPALVAMLGYDSAEELLKVSLARDLYVDPEQRMRLIAAHEGRKSFQNVEVRWRRKDGRPITVRLSGRALIDGQGQPTEFEMIAEDVTERRALEDQLRQSQKMEAIGRLAGGIAHDFNNLLTVIKGYSELMLEELELADPLYCEVDEIKKAADRAAGLTRQLLAFSRQQVLAPRVLDLNSVIRNMERLLHRLLGEDINLTTSLDSGLGHIKADPGQIEQVVMNLAVNARDAMPNGGQLTIETMNVDLDENYVREHVTVKPGCYVMIAVSDTGFGMTEEIRARIFEPFFTTKEPGKGTGLGLSTVYGIVKQSEGYVWVYSEAGIGTTFKVYLPRVDAPADVTPYHSNGLLTYRGTETILLVEDEDGVRALVRQILLRQGYTILEARHGEEALLLCERHQGRIDLLLTDVVLQQMSGRELAERLIRLRPEMRVLYVSGYTDDAIVQHGVLSAGTAFLQKPFTTDALTRKVRQVLNVDPTNRSGSEETVPAEPLASS
jgi:two-component system, cell cycle sensor histidine kinase and response regulator CckA